MALDLKSYVIGKQNGGGGDITLKTLNVTENGTTTAPSGEAYDEVIVAVPEAQLESKAITITENGEQTVTPTEGKDGMSSVVIATNVQPDLQSKTATENGEVTPDEGYDGLSSVMVAVPPPMLQSKNVTSNGTVTPDEGYDGLSSVGVNVPESKEEIALNVTENGTYTPETGKAFGQVTVSVASQGIVEGTETLSFNDNDFVVAVKVYGDTIHYRQFFGGTSATTFTPFRYLSNIIFADEVRKINRNAFEDNDGLITLTIPATCQNFGGYVFTNLYKLEELYLLGGGNLGSRCIGQIQTLKACQIGSVGNGLVSFVGGELFYQMTQSELSITIFCIGSLIDDYLSRIRNRATNATIIFKASEDTTYNGENFSAGETILTSVVN